MLEKRHGFGDSPDGRWATEIEDAIADALVVIGNMSGGPGQQIQPALDKLWAARGGRFDGQGPTRPFGKETQ